MKRIIYIIIFTLFIILLIKMCNYDIKLPNKNKSYQTKENSIPSVEKTTDTINTQKKEITDSFRNHPSVDKILIDSFAEPKLAINNPFQTGEYKITGSVSGFKSGRTLYLLDYKNHAIKVINKTRITDGKFELKGKISEPRRVRLSTSKESFTIGEKVASTKFFLSDTVISIEGNFNNFWNANVIGGQYQREYMLYKGNNDRYEKLIDSLRDRHKVMPSDYKTKIRLDSLRNRRYDVQADYINNNLDSYISYSVLDFFKASLGKDGTDSLYKKLNPVYKSTEYAKDIEGYLKNSNNFQKGDTIPNITLRGDRGKTINLYDLKSNYILIDIWTPGCYGSYVWHKAINENLTEIKEATWDIFSICIYVNEESWLQYTKRDKITWSNTIDDGNMIDFFSIWGTPTTFLIDKNYVVIEKNVNMENLSTLISRYN